MKDVAVGDRVSVTDKGEATVMFIGDTLFAPGFTWIGVELDVPKGKNDGSVQGERYFSCKDKYGAFVREDAVIVVSSSRPMSPVSNAEDISIIQKVRTPSPKLRLQSISPSNSSLAELLSCQRALEKKEEDILKLEQKLKQLTLSTEQKDKKFEELNEVLQLHVASEKSRNDSTNSDKKNIETLQAEIKSLKSQLDKVQGENQTNLKVVTSKLERSIEKLETDTEELNGMVESLTLDKEQFSLDKEIAEERVQEMEIEIEQLKLDVLEAKRQPKNGQDVDLVEENEKLREALKRLYSATGTEKTELTKQVRSLTKQTEVLTASCVEVETLRERKKILEGQVEELKSMLDASESYETMVEELSEQNLELSDQNAELKLANEELEELKLLSEELDQQHKDEERQMEEQVQALSTQVEIARNETRRLAEKLQAEQRVVDELTLQLNDSQQSEGTLHEKLKYLSGMEQELSQTKSNVRSAKLALMDEEQNLRTRSKQLQSALLAQRVSEFTMVHMKSLVPDGVLSNGPFRVLEMFESVQTLEVHSNTLGRLVQLDTDAGCQVSLLGFTIGENSRLFLEIASTVSSLQMLIEWSARFQETFMQVNKLVGILLDSVDEDQLCYESFVADLTASSDQLQVLVDRGLAELGPSKVLVDDSKLYIQLRTFLLQCHPVNDSVIGDICQVISRLADDWINSSKSSPFPAGFPTLLSSTQIAIEAQDIDIVNSIWIQWKSFKMTFSKNESKPTLFGAWEAFGESCRDQLGQVAESQKELDTVKGALRRRVLEVHEKNGALEALAVIRDGLQSKLDNLRLLSMENQDAGLVRSEMQAQLEEANSKYSELQNQSRIAIEQLEYKIAAFENKSPILATKNNPPPSPCESPLSSATFIYLKDQIAFWKKRALLRLTSQLKDLPRSIDNSSVVHSKDKLFNDIPRTKLLLEQALVAQSLVKVVDLSEANPRQEFQKQQLVALKVSQKVGDIGFNRKMDSGIHVGSITLPSTSHSLCRPIHIGIETFENLFKPLF